jgi:hypothetical protein
MRMHVVGLKRSIFQVLKQALDELVFGPVCGSLWITQAIALQAG